MILRIASRVAEAILAHARADLPNEACGLLLGTPETIPETIIEARPARNIADHPETSFEIDPAMLLTTYRTARGQGLKVIGHYHSHPGGHPEPSRRDAARALENGQYWLIATKTELTGWIATPDAAAALLHGRFQPVTLERV